MKNAPEHLIFESAHRANILPLTSVCNVRCVFCSHSQNPPDIQIYRIPHRTLEQIEDTLEFIDPGKKIVIGESVTRITEGEPLTHPEIRKILAMIRERFPDTVIQLTTNGSMVDRDMADYFACLGGVEVNLSLNSADPEIRRMLMKDRKPDVAVMSAKFLCDAGVSCHGSLVAMPHVTGWEDLGKSILYLSDCGVKTIRVFLPGFTRLAPPELVFANGMWQQLADYIDSLKERISVPVTIEPPLITDLNPVVRGIIKDSPAHSAGIQQQDLVLTVDGHNCVSRVDAFNRILRGGNVRLEVLRGGEKVLLTLDKVPGQPSGIVMDYDIDPVLIEDIKRAARRYNKVNIMCSSLAATVLALSLQTGPDAGKYQITPVKNRYFGGSIMAAGLLVVSDFINAVRESEGNNEAEAVFLPAITFDQQGFDLVGRSYFEIQEVSGKRVEII